MTAYLKARIAKLERAKSPKIGLDRAKTGRSKGTPNKVTALLKDAIIQAATKAGGEDGMVGYLTKQAKENPGPFMSLLGKVLPMQVAGLDGADGEPTAIQIRIVDPRT